jgi:hypothetical protein
MYRTSFFYARISRAGLVQYREWIFNNLLLILHLFSFFVAMALSLQRQIFATRELIAHNGGIICTLLLAAGPFHFRDDIESPSPLGVAVIERKNTPDLLEQE